MKCFTFAPGHAAPSTAGVGVVAPRGWSVLTCVSPSSANKAGHQQRNLPWAFYLQHLLQDPGGRSQLLPHHTILMCMGRLFPTPGRWHKETFLSRLQAASRLLWAHGWALEEEDTHLEDPEDGSVLLVPAEETPLGT